MPDCDALNDHALNDDSLNDDALNESVCTEQGYPSINLPKHSTNELIGLLRADLQAAGFSVEALTGLWGENADSALHRGQRVPALRRLSRLPEPSRLSTLATVFVLGTPVLESHFASAVTQLGIGGAISLGLVGIDDADETGERAIRPLLDLRPYSFADSNGVGSWWIVSDLGELSVGGALRVDHVLGVGGASLTLSGLMVTTPVDRALDLGTGCGIQALHASRHAKQVIATDISQRALEIAAMNAELNEVKNIELRLGSLFDPVRGERFGHIVSNPPFVITPRTEGVPAYEYRDGGMVGDALVAAVIAGVSDHLEPGGTAQLLGNWEYRGGESGLDRVGAWTDATGLDAWVVERERQDTELYAETWIRDGGLRGGVEFDRLSSAWLDDFESREVSAVGFGYLTLRARSPFSATDPVGTATQIRRLERLDGPIGFGLGAHIEKTLAAIDSLARLSDDELGRAHLTVAPDVTEERHYWPGASDPTVITLHQGGGFGRSIALDTGLAALVGACDAELSVRAIIAAIAQLLEVDEAALSLDLLPRIRELTIDGMLLL